MFDIIDARRNHEVHDEMVVSVYLSLAPRVSSATINDGYRIHFVLSVCINIPQANLILVQMVRYKPFSYYHFLFLSSSSFHSIGSQNLFCGQGNWFFVLDLEE